MSKQMRAWTYTHEGYPSALKLSNIPAPTKPSPTQLYVRVKAAALNPVDIQLMNFPLWPYLPSSIIAPEKGIAEDFSGVVEAAGDQSGFESGDEVFGITFTLDEGTLQELAVVDTKASVVVKKPSAWSWPQAAALPLVWLTARTTIAAVEPDVTKTKKVAILGGSSSTGMYAIHLAAARGWDVLSTCSSRNTEFVKSMGANTVVDYTSTSVPEAVKKFAPDAIIDCVGGVECLDLAKRYVTIVGDKTSRASMGGAAIYLWYPRMLARMLMGRLGLSGLKYDCVNLDFNKQWLEETLELPHDKIQIDSTWKFEQAKEAFERLNTSRARGKVIVTIE